MIPWNPRRFILIVLGLFILNCVIVGIIAPQEKRIQVPYNPTFLDQVRAGLLGEGAGRHGASDGDAHWARLPIATRGSRRA